MNFETILDVITYVATCPAHSCNAPCEPGMACDKHLLGRFGPNNVPCPICVSDPPRIATRMGLCLQCAKRRYHLRDNPESNVVIRSGQVISVICVVPMCHEDVRRQSPWPLCSSHGEIADAHYCTSAEEAYKLARDSLRIEPKILCGIDDCNNPVARLGMCQNCYLRYHIATHEFLKGIPRSQGFFRR